LTLPPQRRAGSFVSQARVESIAVTPAEPFIVGGQPDPHSIRISIGGPRTPALLEQRLEAPAEMLNGNQEPAQIAN
jgi:DNA-binding transcriptional MocR family regulator